MKKGGICITKEEYLKNPNICLFCSNKILPKDKEKISDVRRKKFCNHSCSALFNRPKRKNKIYNCMNCNKELNKKGKYCSIKCQQEYEYIKYIDYWKKGLNNGMRGQTQVSDYIRRYLYKKYDNKCCECGWNKINPYTKKIPLEIEHIDGNYLNNSEKNLKLLCPNCHSLTSTYKGANKNKGRKNRNK